MCPGKVVGGVKTFSGQRPETLIRYSPEVGEGVQMDFAQIAKLAMDLGVIPALALFLVMSIQRQNNRLTDMVEKREANNLEMLKLLIGEMSEYKQKLAKGASLGSDKD
jgi:hypothetical protein